MSVRPHYSKQNKFQVKPMFPTGETVGLTEWITALLRQRVWWVLHHNEHVIIIRGHQDFVLFALNPEVGQLVGWIQVPDDGLGPLG